MYDSETETGTHQVGSRMVAFHDDVMVEKLFFASLALSEGTPLVTDGFPLWIPLTEGQYFGAFFAVVLNKLLNKHPSCRSFKAKFDYVGEI